MKKYLLKKFAIGDLHGNFKALEQILKKSFFNSKKDHLYFLGDLADGYPDPDKILLKFLSIKNFFPIFGNHDLFLKEWVETDRINPQWVRMKNYTTTIEKLIPYKNELTEYFKKCEYWRVYKNILMCHGGFNHRRFIEKQKQINFCINRRLYETAKQYENQKIKIKIKSNYILDTAIIGHSPTKNHKPDFVSNVINIDTGGGNGGKVTIIDLDSMRYLQSNFSKKLYKGF